MNFSFLELAKMLAWAAVMGAIGFFVALQFGVADDRALMTAGTGAIFGAWTEAKRLDHKRRGSLPEIK